MSDISLTREQAAALWKRLEEGKKQRAESMPTEAECLRVMIDAWNRLHELGWNDAIYCPKDGTIFDSISVGSTGIHDCYYQGTWPDGRYWIFDGGDLWPAAPILFRKKKADSNA